MISEILGTIIGGLQHVANIYSLIGFFCLICIYLIAYHHIEATRCTTFLALGFLKMPKLIRKKKLIVFLLFIGISTVVSLSAKIVYDIARDERQEDMPSMCVLKYGPGEELNRSVKLQLLDIKTLKSKKNDRGWCNDKERERIYKTVFEKAGLENPKQKARNALNMNGEQWGNFLNDQGKYKDRILDTPFARLRIYIDGKIDQNFENRYFFKGENITVGEAGKDVLRTKFQIKHLYDLYSMYSAEQEAMVVQLVW